MAQGPHSLDHYSANNFNYLDHTVWRAQGHIHVEY